MESDDAGYENVTSDPYFHEGDRDVAAGLGPPIVMGPGQESSSLPPLRQESLPRSEVGGAGSSSGYCIGSVSPCTPRWLPTASDDVAAEAEGPRTVNSPMTEDVGGSMPSGGSPDSLKAGFAAPQPVSAGQSRGSPTPLPQLASLRSGLTAEWASTATSMYRKTSGMWRSAIEHWSGDELCRLFQSSDPGALTTLLESLPPPIRSEYAAFLLDNLAQRGRPRRGPTALERMGG